MTKGTLRMALGCKRVFGRLSDISLAPKRDKPWFGLLVASLTISIWMSVPAAVSQSDGTAALNRPIADKWALIIGISQFKDPSLNLRFPAKDAKDFRDFLLNKENFAQDHVKLLLNEQATRENILDQLGDSWLPRVAAPDDLVVIYVSSHGSPADMDIGNVNYLIAYDTNKDRLYSTAIAMQDLCRIIKARVHSDRTLIVLDACHSGATAPDGKGLVRVGNVNAEEIAQGTGQLVISSSSPNQTSWESKTYQNGVFTKRLMDALQINGEKTKLGDAYTHLKSKVQEEVLQERGKLQTPELKSKWEGKDLMLAAPPTSPRRAPVEETAQLPTPINAGSEGAPAGHVTPGQGNDYGAPNQVSSASVTRGRPSSQSSHGQRAAPSAVVPERNDDRKPALAIRPAQQAAAPAISSSRQPIQGYAAKDQAPWEYLLGTWRHEDDPMSAVTIKIFKQDDGIFASYEKLEGEWNKKCIEVGDWLFVNGQPVSATGNAIRSDEGFFYRPDDKKVEPYTKGSIKVEPGLRPNTIKITRQNYGHGYFSGWTVGYPAVVGYPDNLGLWKRVGPSPFSAKGPATPPPRPQGVPVSATAAAAQVTWRSALGVFQYRDDDFSSVDIKIYEDADGIQGVYNRLEGSWTKKCIEVGDFLFKNGHPTSPGGNEIRSDEAIYYRSDDKSVAPYTKGSLKVTVGPKPGTLSITRQNYEHGWFSGWTVGYPSVVGFPPV
ncbi:MAG TPA: caspase family protein, partial [Candidatus Obscuribacterales bacterium]